MQDMSATKAALPEGTAHNPRLVAEGCCGYCHGTTFAIGFLEDGSTIICCSDRECGKEWKGLRPNGVSAGVHEEVASCQKIKKGRPRLGTEERTLEATKPWLAEGMSRATWYRRKNEPDPQS